MENNCFSPEKHGFNVRNIKLQKYENDGKFIHSAIVGKAETGKTTLAIDLVQKINPEKIVVISESPNDRNEYKKAFGDKSFVFDKYNSEIIETLFDNQKNETRIAQKKQIVVIVENCIVPYTDQSFKRLYLNGRHYGIKLIYCVQQPYDLSPMLLHQLTNVFIFKSKDKNYNKVLSDKFCITPFESFHEILQQFDPYECLVIDYSTVKNNDYYYYKKR